MKIVVGDILQSSAQTLVNTVNCVGVMGKGIALEFKKRFPDMFADYARRCERGEVKPGVPYVYRELFPPQIVNFPTKDHWKSVSRLADIERGLALLLEHYKEWGIESLAMPPLGCGNGQLEWRVVGPLICQCVAKMEVPVEMYAPYGTPPRELTVEFLAVAGSGARVHSAATVQSALNPAWIALVETLRRMEAEPYHWPVGRIIFQKIAYVATRQGLPTGFRYQKGSFGPFSPDLKNAQTKLMNDSLLCEERLGPMFSVKVGPNYERVRARFEAVLAPWVQIIERTMDLFARLNSEQAEIVATVLYTADSLKQSTGVPPSEGEVLDAVMEWKQKRQPPLDRLAVASAIRNLGVLRWLDARYDPALPLRQETAAVA
jgi:O-acetyl-ADP-ribose deacetylase (regulator of RNase III)/uncharacterized protein YwgA